MVFQKFIRWVVILCHIRFIVGRRMPLGLEGSIRRNAGAAELERKSVPFLNEFQRALSCFSVNQGRSETNSICAFTQAPRRNRCLRPSSNGKVLSKFGLSSRFDKSTNCATSLFDASGAQSENDVPKSSGWNGEVVANSNDGRIRGCSIRPLTESNSDETPNTEWIITIDGVEADLGRFSEAIYKKFIQDAKQQRFQGFRPGTIPPHLEPTYRTFAMDECARETILEAMQQNNIRPFENCRSEIFLYDFCIPPPANSKSNSKNKKPKKSSRKKQPTGATADDTAVAEQDGEDISPPEPAWQTFATMKEAIDAGWRPGRSFSFSAKNVRGQKVKVGTPLGTSPIGVNF